VTYISQRGFEERLRRRLRAMRRVAVVGVGDELNVHDRLGMLAAKEVEGLHLSHVRVFLAGTVPESVTGPIRRYKPDAVVLLDAADMGARPGTVALVEPREIRASLLSTHALPLSVVMDFLEKDTGARVMLVGIQPDLGNQGFAPAGPEQAGLTRLVVSIFHIFAEPPPKGSRTAARKAGRGSRAL
jgi:hydrogenase 3 maturation protease